MTVATSPSAPVLRWITLAGRGILRLAGADRISFLQGLVSNDVRRVGPDCSVYVALLTPQGKYLHDFFVMEEPREAGEGALFLEVDAGSRQDLLNRLLRYKLRAKLDFEDVTDHFEVVALTGAGAYAAVGQTPTPGATRPFGTGIAVVDPRLGALGVRLVLPTGTAPAVMAEVGASSGTPEDYDLLRLDLGVPDGHRDLLPESSLLLECNLDSLNAISWTKGCYVGQEVTARTRYRGLVRRRLWPVRVEGPLPPPGTAVHQGEQDVGEVRSGRGNLALALLRSEALEAGAVPLGAGSAVLTPLVPGWLRG